MESENPLPSVEEAAEQAILFSQVLCPLYDSEPESECHSDLSTLSDDDDFHSLPASPMAPPSYEVDHSLFDSVMAFLYSGPTPPDIPGFDSDGDPDLEEWVPTERGSPVSSEVVFEQEAGLDGRWGRSESDWLPDPIVPDSNDMQISRSPVPSGELIHSVFEMEADTDLDPDWADPMELSTFQPMDTDGSLVTRPTSPDSLDFFDEIPDELFDCLPEQDMNPNPNPNPEPEPDWEALSTDSSTVPDLEEMVRNLEWEVLLAVNNIYGSDEITFLRQFLEHDSTVKGGPPASVSAVESLPNITVDESKGELLCAVCKETVLVGESVKRLPCLHDYHASCILPWLGIRNTCPLCRFELPTDDLDYESWRGRGRQENQV